MLLHTFSHEVGTSYTPPVYVHRRPASEPSCCSQRERQLLRRLRCRETPRVTRLVLHTLAGGEELSRSFEPCLSENSSCRIKVTNIEGLYQEYQAKGLLEAQATVSLKPWGAKEFVVFDSDRVLITFFEHTH